MRYWINAASLLIAAVLGTACGYRPMVAAFPEGNGAIAIPLVGNTTPIVDLVGPMTRSLRIHAATAGLTVKGAGAPKLVATIVSVTSAPGQLTREGDTLYPLDKLQTISVVAHIEDRDGRILVEEQRFTHAGRSLAGNTVETELALEADRRYGILDDIAAMIVEYMFMGR